MKQIRNRFLKEGSEGFLYSEISIIRDQYYSLRSEIMELSRHRRVLQYWGVFAPSVMHSWFLSAVAYFPTYLTLFPLFVVLLLWLSAYNSRKWVNTIADYTRKIEDEFGTFDDTPGWETWIRDIRESRNKDASFATFIMKSGDRQEELFWLLMVIVNALLAWYHFIK